MVKSSESSKVFSLFVVSTKNLRFFLKLKNMKNVMLVVLKKIKILYTCAKVLWQAYLNATTPK